MTVTRAVMECGALLLTAVIGCGSDSGGGSGLCAFPPTPGMPTADEVRQWVVDYKAAHPGNGGKDWDINAKTAAEVDAHPDAARLLGICGADRRPVIPLIAWEYGGSDHPWIAPEMSALVYCDSVPVAANTDSWSYDAASDHVVADVSILFPDENPCAGRTGTDLVTSCIGDPSNFEILVDTASYRDGACAGYSLSEASTELRLGLPDGSKIHLYTD